MDRTPHRIGLNTIMSFNYLIDLIDVYEGRTVFLVRPFSMTCSLFAFSYG